MGTNADAIEYLNNRLIEQLLGRKEILTDEQLDRIIAVAQSELWDRFNQPSGQIFDEK